MRTTTAPPHGGSRRPALSTLLLPPLLLVAAASYLPSAEAFRRVPAGGLGRRRTASSCRHVALPRGWWPPTRAYQPFRLGASVLSSAATVEGGSEGDGATQGKGATLDGKVRVRVCVRVRACVSRGGGAGASRRRAGCGPLAPRTAKPAPTQWHLLVISRLFRSQAGTEDTGIKSVELLLLLGQIDARVRDSTREVKDYVDLRLDAVETSVKELAAKQDKLAGKQEETGKTVVWAQAVGSAVVLLGGALGALLSNVPQIKALWESL